MEVQIRERTADNDAVGLTLDVSLDFDDMTLLREQAHEAYEIEQSLPPEARTSFGNSDEAAYMSEFVKTRAVNDALESCGIMPLVRPHVEVKGLSETSLYSCAVTVIPRPGIGLVSLDPIDLKTNRIPKPGVSMQAAREGGSASDFLDDEKTLRITLTKRLNGEYTEDEMRALSDEYQADFEKELAKRGMSPDIFCETHGLDEEQYAIMMARRALDEAHWNCALDAVFDGNGLALEDGDVLEVLEERAAGNAEKLLDLYELRNETYQWAEIARRRKALAWLRENGLK